MFPQFTHVHDDYAIPGNCEVTDIPLEPLVGNRIDFKIITKNQNNSCCSNGGSHIIAQVQPSRGADVVPVEVKDNKDGSEDGSYSVSIVTPTSMLDLITYSGTKCHHL